MSLNCLGNDKQEHEIGWIRGQRAYVAAITVCNSKLLPILLTIPQQTFNIAESIGGLLGSGEASINVNKFTIDDFYATNSNIHFNLTIDSNARSEFRKIPQDYLGVPNILYDADLNKFLEPTILPPPLPLNWRQTYKNIKLQVSYLVNEIWVKNAEINVQARAKGYGSFRPYNRQMPFRIKSSNFINGLDEVKDMALNNMSQNLARMTEYVIYKIFNDYGMPSPRANYIRVFINDTTVKISEVQDNLIITNGDHYLVNGMRLKFASLQNVSDDQIFYVISNGLTGTTFKISSTLNGSEFSLTNFTPEGSSEYIEFFTDYGEYINVENMKNEYKLTQAFGQNNTTHLYEVNVTTGPNELNALEEIWGYEVDYGNANNRSDLENFTRKISSYTNWYQDLSTYIDIEQFIKFSVVETYCGNSDGYCWFLNNSHMHSDANGIFRLIPWGSDSYFQSNLINSIGLWSTWIHQCFSHVETLEMFRDEMLNFHNWIQNQSDILNHIDNIFNQKITDFESDKKKQSSITTQLLTDQKEAIKDFIQGRGEEISYFLNRPYCPLNVVSTFNGQIINMSWTGVNKNLNNDTISDVAYVIFAGATPKLGEAYFVDNISDTNYSFDFLGTIDETIYFFVVPTTSYLGFPGTVCIAHGIHKGQGGAKLGGSVDLDLNSSGTIRVTEVMSSGGIADWFEITNLGQTSVDLTGWRIDDSNPTFSTSLAINAYDGWTTIEPNESIVVIESSNPSTDIPAFRTFWNNNSIKMASYLASSGAGLGSGGDAVVIFNAVGTEVTRVTFGSATSGVSFYWQYDNSGNLTSSGKNTLGQRGAYQGSSNNIGSPGTYTA